MHNFKIHKSNSDILIAISDSNLIGSVLKDGDIEFEITESFYGHDKVSFDSILHDLEKATIINAIGKNTIELLIKNKFISEESLLVIAGVPHAQAIFV